MLAQDPLVEAVVGVEQQVDRDGMVHADIDPLHAAHLVVVGDGRDRALGGARSISIVTWALSGNSAPRQRRGRNGLIGVSASSGAPIGMIGPWTERLYAVEPAGVATRMPSATSSASRSLPSTRMRSRAA